MKMNIAQLWAICIKFMWDEDYVNGLSSFLKKHHAQSILDCAGGNGFPSIELRKLGFDVTYSDGSKLMFDFFIQKLKESGLQIPHFFVDWKQLSTKIRQKFDAVLCHGNSLIYVDSWDENNISEISRDNIKQSLQEFYNVLKNGGFLYVDTTNKKEFNQPTYPIIEEFGEKIIDGKKIKLTWELTHDYQKKIRTWKSILNIDGQSHEFVYYSYLLAHDDLISLLKEVDFSEVEETQIDGENNYNVYVAYKDGA